jgi:carbonic anhydrase/acetyltransferase-like protein (isoleucine patch superfamily)
MMDINVSESASLFGTLMAGRGCHIAQGAVVRSADGQVRIGHGSLFLENGVILGGPRLPVAIGSKVVFGHRCLVIGALVGDLCEVGNSTILMPGARLGARCMTGEGTLIPPGEVIPDDSVVVGRPGKIIRKTSEADVDRVLRLRGGDFSLPAGELPRHDYPLRRNHAMGRLYAYGDKQPLVHPTAYLFDSAEITGDVIIGEDCIIGAGVKIIGDSHGPVRIGNRVQILENAVLHLLPDNRLIIEDDVIIGPGTMIHGCRIGSGCIIEPGAIVCDYSRLGKNCVVSAGSLVKQRDDFPDGSIIEGFPGKSSGRIDGAPSVPAWALSMETVRALEKTG